MTYISGTITNSDPGAALYALMAPALSTAGYTLVDTVVITTKTHKIWKSPAASNVQNLDWYLDIIYTTTGTGSIWLQPFEFYDPATDLGYRGSFFQNNAGIDATTFSRFGATGSALETNWVGSNTNMGSILPATAFGYWCSITTDRVILMQSNEPSYLLYTGFYLPDSLYAAKAGAALFPLLQTKCSSASNAASNASTASLTRVPPNTLATMIGANWFAHVAVPTNTLISAYGGALPVIPIGPVISYPSVVMPIPVVSYTGVAPAIYGQVRDTASALTSGVSRGDTVTIGGVSWVLTTSGSGTSLLFKAV